MARTIRVKNWSEFQHYKDRNPAWIKLHKRLLDDFSFHCLPVASRALAPMIWLLASESKDGAITASWREIAFRLHLSENELVDAANPLFDAGFLLLERDASDALAKAEQNAIPEKERETEEEKETERVISAACAADDGKDHPNDRIRGTRLPADWEPCLEDRQFAESLGLVAGEVAAEFRDFWCAVPGAKGRKLDWSRTYRNRCRDIARRGRPRENGSGRAGFVAAVGRVLAD